MRIASVAKSFARRLGYDVRRTGEHPYKRPSDFIRSRNVDLVVDVGANVGQYGSLLRNDGYEGMIVSFEPISTAYEELSALAKNDGNWKTINSALGAKRDIISINVSESSVFSSILPQLPEAIAFEATAHVVRSESIRVVPLDGIFDELPRSKAPFLKMDTQGYEEQVLLGAQNCLSKFVGVQMELPIMPLYEGTWKFHEAVAYMVERGFEISNIVPTNYDRTDIVSLVEVDCIFHQRAPRIKARA